MCIRDRPRGTPSTSAPAVTSAEPAASDRMPNLPSVGAQSRLKKFASPISVKTEMCIRDRCR